MSDNSSLATRHSSLILASSSPRRAEILTSLGIPFTADAADIDEAPHPGEAAETTAVRLASAKADAVATRHPGAWILAADTLVVLSDGSVLGKPSDDAEAARMLTRLSGCEHRVVTGVCLRSDSPGTTLTEWSRVRFAALSGEEVAWYVATGEPRDKAGAYAVQGLGARFIESIDGSFTNVMGLPARAVYRLLRETPSLAPLALSCF